MSKKLALVGGLPRMVEESATPTIYDEYLLVVSGTPQNSNEINVEDAGTGDPITLPNSGEYSGEELIVYLNGNRISDVFDYNYVGSGTRTQISLTFDLMVGDVLRFRKDRLL